MTDKPNPGSPEAEALGCTCPVLDNNHGKGIAVTNEGVPDVVFWYHSRCPVHILPPPLEVDPETFIVTKKENTDAGA